MEIFRGPDGLRAGWRAGLFVALLLAYGFLVVLAMRFLLRDQLHALLQGAVGPLEQPVALLAVNEAVVLIPTLLATFTMAKVERRSVWSYGLIDRRAATHFAAGVLWGFGALSVLLGVLAAAGFFAVDGVALHTAAALRYGLEWGIGFLAVAVGEELMVRGYLQTTLARGMGFWPAAVLLSAIFGAMHMGNGGEKLFGLLSAGTVGLLFCLVLWRSGSLWWPIGFHAAWDWAQSYFYGTPDSGMRVHGHLLDTHAIGNALWSGGSVGPEGSILVFAILAAVALAVQLTMRREPPAEAALPVGS
jgi:uncharacterized protein